MKPARPTTYVTVLNDPVTDRYNGRIIIEVPSGLNANYAALSFDKEPGTFTAISEQALLDLAEHAAEAAKLLAAKREAANNRKPQPVR